MSPPKSLGEALASGPLLLDGAMGSLLYERGVLHTRSYDELNVSQPELIASVHADYVAAGAEMIETNTFGANRMALARHGLADQATAINRAGVDLARKAAGDRAWSVPRARDSTSRPWPSVASPASRSPSRSTRSC
jgi:methionine synthase / methylenetetrahydrofolate reductase(NADPH)